MDYISVKEAAEKFNISERRVQKLCETYRIEGSRMVSGVWLIPAGAAKPIDERTNEIPNTLNGMSLNELCRELSISTATGRNWIKLGKLLPEYTEKKIPYFSKSYVDNLKEDIKSGKNNALKSRRNKKYVSGNTLYGSYVSESCQNVSVLQDILGIIENNQIKLCIDIIQYILAECALQLFCQKQHFSYENQTNLLFRYLQDQLSLGKYDLLIEALINDSDQAIRFCNEYPVLFSVKYTYEEYEDVLGLIYISCKNIGSRKATGSYYTPTNVVKKLISKLNITRERKILDPCCGTGNFLLQLPPCVSFDQIYGNDIDTTSVKIARLNMALRHPNISVEEICEHITESDFLLDYSKTGFHYIIGNPPWGYNFSEAEKKILHKNYKAASGKNMESYDLFIERAVSCLAYNGRISYVLPEAILNVKAHIDIRNIILKFCSIRYLEFLGNVFDGVQCPCIILQLDYTGKNLSTVGMTVNTGKESFEISTERLISSEYFSFIANDQEYKTLEKIKNTDNAVFLAGNADFALGIVTGNNKEYISSKKTSENEMVLKGSDISKYHINNTDNYIVFEPDHFQQIAPTEMYRAPEKLLYRFISGQLVFAYDNKQTLSLNSCNIVIPKIKGLDIKYILAILNSRVAQFIYKKEFNSIKVLRSHIENIPIPNVDSETQNKIIKITDLLIQGLPAESLLSTYDKLDCLIFDAFHLSLEEQEIVKAAVDGENKFLL